jgi:hypothetical protein
VKTVPLGQQALVTKEEGAGKMLCDSWEGTHIVTAK